MVTEKDELGVFVPVTVALEDKKTPHTTTEPGLTVMSKLSSAMWEMERVLN